MKIPTDKLKFVGTLANEYTKTLLEMVYIINGVAVFLLLFDLVDSSKPFRYAVGSIAVAFSVVAFATLSNHGVKNQTNVKKGRK